MKKVLRGFAVTGMILLFLGSFFMACEQPSGSSTDPTDAAAPTISAQPTGGVWDVTSAATFPITVTAASTDGGTISYQWYSNTSASATGGTAISGQTQATLTLAKTAYATNGARYFYVVVTNALADNGDGGVKTATLASNAITVTVSGNAGVVTEYVAAPQSVKDALAGTWQEPYATYTIDAATFESGSDYGGYGGTIENVRVKQGSLDEGFITIKYTSNDNAANAVGRYYVIHFQTLTDNAMEISGAYIDGDPDFGDSGYGGGKETLEAAETAFTMNSGAFEYHTAITKVEALAQDLVGTWTSPTEYADHFVITGERLAYYGSGDGPVAWSGDIAAVVEFTEDAGVIILKYDADHKQVYYPSDHYGDPEYILPSKGDYIGIYYNDLAKTESAKLSSAYTTAMPDGSEQPTLEAAQAEFTEANYGTYIAFHPTYVWSATE